MKQKVIIYKGLPASGKTTKAYDEIAKGQGSIVRINKDDLRTMLHGGKHSKGREQFIINTRDDLILMALGENKSVIVDDTNLHPKHKERIREIVAGYYPEVEIVVDDSFLAVPLEECIRRDSKREKPVGKDVIIGMYNQFLRKSPPLQDPNLPNAIICDLDGTLANLDGRNPYDASTCENDSVVWPVRDLLWFWHKMSHHKIIFVSGSPARFRPYREKWLAYNFPWLKYELYTRLDEDNRPDYILKKELYENYIKNKYNIKFVVDDRPQVVRMWRSEGLFVFDVNQTGREF